MAGAPGQMPPPWMGDPSMLQAGMPDPAAAAAMMQGAQPNQGNPMQAHMAAAHAQAMMWHMHMGANPALMMPPYGMPTAPTLPQAPPAASNPYPMLHIRVEGLGFEYQLTEEDVRKVFARYGGVTNVQVEREGTSATVQFDQMHHAVASQRDLDKKPLAGMSGAMLRVDFAPNSMPQPQYDPAAGHMAAAAAAAYSMNPMMPNAFHYPPVPPAPGGPDMAAAAAAYAAAAGMAPGGMPGGMPGAPPQGGAGRPKKYTCKLEVNIENESEFRVGSHVIQIARTIWQDPKFQECGGKTRLRGKGVGGPHEADEPLALCISCQDQQCFERAVQIAEQQLEKVHNNYRVFCAQKGMPVPDLQVKVSRGNASAGPGGGDPEGPGNRGERPANAPEDDEIERLIEERNEARKAANFKRSDEIRDFLKSRGVVLMDEKNAKGNFKGREVTKWRYWRP